MERDKHRQTEAKTGKMAENRWTQRETDKTETNGEADSQKETGTETKRHEAGQGRAGQEGRPDKN